MAPLGVLSAFAVSLLVGGLAIRFGSRRGIVDLADEHLKPHGGSPVPLGGAAVVAGSQLGLAVTGNFDPWLLAVVLFVWGLGLADDLRGLSPSVRLIGAVAAGLVLAVTSFDPSGVPEGVFWIVAVVVAVNAINLFDGLDALAGSVSMVVFLGLAWFSVVQRFGDPVLGLVMAAALLGFLYWNRPAARLFLGDNGAYAVAVLIVWAAERSSPDFGAGVVAMSLLGMPLIDLGITVLRRWRSGAELFAGDRDHTYDLLHESGFSTTRVASVFVLLQMIWVTVVVMLSDHAGDRVAFVIALIAGLVVVGYGGLRVGRRRDRPV